MKNSKLKNVIKGLKDSDNFSILKDREVVKLKGGTSDIKGSDEDCSGFACGAYQL